METLVLKSAIYSLKSSLVFLNQEDKKTIKDIIDKYNKSLSMLNSDFNIKDITKKEKTLVNNFIKNSINKKFNNNDIVNDLRNRIKKWESKINEVDELYLNKKACLLSSKIDNYIKHLNLRLLNINNNFINKIDLSVCDDFVKNAYVMLIRSNDVNMKNVIRESLRIELYKQYKHKYL